MQEKCHSIVIGLQNKNILCERERERERETIKYLLKTCDWCSSNQNFFSFDWRPCVWTKHYFLFPQQIEETTLPNPKNPKLALIRGQRSVISRDFAAYRSALERHKYSIDAPNWLRSKRRASTQTAQNLTGIKKNNKFFSEYKSLEKRFD